MFSFSLWLNGRMHKCNNIMHHHHNCHWARTNKIVCVCEQQHQCACYSKTPDNNNVSAETTHAIALPQLKTRRNRANVCSDEGKTCTQALGRHGTWSCERAFGVTTLTHSDKRLSLNEQLPTTTTTIVRLFACVFDGRIRLVLIMYSQRSSLFVFIHISHFEIRRTSVD